MTQQNSNQVSQFHLFPNERTRPLPVGSIVKVFHPESMGLILEGKIVSSASSGQSGSIQSFRYRINFAPKTSRGKKLFWVSAPDITAMQIANEWIYRDPLLNQGGEKIEIAQLLANPQTIRVNILPATDTRGTRVQAQQGSRRTSLPYQHEFDHALNVLEAAKKLATRLDLQILSPDHPVKTDAGWVFQTFQNSCARAHNNFIAGRCEGWENKDTAAVCLIISNDSRLYELIGSAKKLGADEIRYFIKLAIQQDNSIDPTQVNRTEAKTHIQSIWNDQNGKGE